MLIETRSLIDVSTCTDIKGILSKYFPAIFGSVSSLEFVLTDIECQLLIILHRYYMMSEYSSHEKISKIIEETEISSVWEAISVEDIFCTFVFVKRRLYLYGIV